jgi:hypothetical protein
MVFTYSAVLCPAAQSFQLFHQMSKQLVVYFRAKGLLNASEQDLAR